MDSHQQMLFTPLLPPLPPTEKKKKNKFSFCIHFEVENHALIFEIPDRMSACMPIWIVLIDIYESEEKIYNF